MKELTIKHVAAHVGCSPMTVSNVLNKKKSVQPAMRKNVLQAIEELGYQPSHWARELGRKKRGSQRGNITRRFGCILNSPVGKYADPYYGEVLEAFEDLLVQKNYELSFVESWDRLNGSERLGIMLNPENIDLVVLLNCENLLQEVRRYIRNIVVAGVYWTDHSVDYVSSDMVEGGWQATTHLLELGHKNIAYLGPMIRAEFINRERETGYRLALNQYDVSLTPRVYHTISSGFEEAFELATEVLKSPDRSSAIFVHSDYMAMGVMKAASRLGLSVPKDLSIVGFNDDRVATMNHPELTTVRIDKIAMGKLLAQVGIERIEEPSLPGRMVMISSQLIVRETTAAYAGNHK